MLKLELYNHSDPPVVMFVNPDFVRSIHPSIRAGHCNVRLSHGNSAYSAGDPSAAFLENVIGAPEKVAGAWMIAKLQLSGTFDPLLLPYVSPILKAAMESEASAEASPSTEDVEQVRTQGELG